jgi:hypothetical protein
VITCQIVTSEADRLAVIDTAWAANGDRAAVL